MYKTIKAKMVTVGMQILWPFEDFSCREILEVRTNSDQSTIILYDTNFNTAHVPAEKNVEVYVP